MIICQISRFRMFVSHEFASLRPADFVGRTKCRKNFFCWNLIFSMQLSPFGQLLWNSRHFKGYDAFFHIFMIICQVSKFRMFVSHDFSSLRPAEFVARTKCQKNFFCWNLIFSIQLSPSGQLLWNSRHFKGYDVFFHIFMIICQISKFPKE